MRSYLLLISLFTFSSVFSQNFDLELEKVAQAMAKKLNTKDKINIAVYPFYDKQKKQTDLSQLVAEDFSIYLNQHNRNYKLIDRVYLDQMLDEHKLNEAGLINPETAKQFGMLIAADVYITGKTYVFPTYIRLQVIAIDTETGERVFSDYKRIPLDYDIAMFLGIKDYKKQIDKENFYKSSNPKCAEQEVGDYCFVNTLNYSVTVKLSDIGTLSSLHRSITISPKEKGCFKNLATSKTYRYAATTHIILDHALPKGEFEIKTCKSDFFTIR